MSLSTYRVLDLTDVKGTYCGKVLADLGFDVVKVEPPEGSAERALGPFFHDRPDTEESLYWFAHNGNKRGITLNLGVDAGRELFRRLARRAHFVVESFAPCHLDRLGLGYQHLSEANPGLIVTSITPFGQTGPYRDFKAADLTILALGGLMNLTGDPDRAPLRLSIEQSISQAGAQAAAATLIAHQFRAISGRGQHVDVSMQEAITQTLMLEQYYWQFSRIIEMREGPATRRGNVIVRQVFPCADGFISWRVFAGKLGSSTQALVDWMAEEDMAGRLVDVDWTALDMNSVAAGQIAEWEEVFCRFFGQHTKATLHKEAIRRGIMLFPVNYGSDLLNDPHLAERRFWRRVEHETLKASLAYPGPPYRVSRLAGADQRLTNDTPRRAPRLGEHNNAVYAELGLQAADVATLRKEGVI